MKFSNIIVLYLQICKVSLNRFCFYLNIVHLDTLILIIILYFRFHHYAKKKQVIHIEI